MKAIYIASVIVLLVFGAIITRFMLWTPPDYQDKADLFKIASHVLYRGNIVCSDEKVIFVMGNKTEMRTVKDICKELIG